MQKVEHARVPSNVSKIDLGCGKNKKEGFIGIDKIDYGQEILWDVTKGIPLPDDSIDEVYSTQFFEHLDEKEINTVVWELVRVCKAGAKIHIEVPSDESDPSYDIAHYSFWNPSRGRGLFYSCGMQTVNPRKEGDNIVIDILA